MCNDTHYVKNVNILGSSDNKPQVWTQKSSATQFKRSTLKMGYKEKRKSAI